MKTLPFGTRTFIMGIINATPDSFSGDGLLCQADWIDAALEQARRFVHAGADILDIGAESTRPGAQPVGQEEELDRLLPLLESLRKENLDVIISVDTSKAAVAKVAIPNCNLTYMDGDEMKAAIQGYLQVLYDANPKSVGGSMPDDGFYY